MNFTDLKKYFKDRSIQCIKLNHSLDPESQSFTNFNSFFQLKDDCETFELYNYKPRLVDHCHVDSLMAKNLMLEPDPQDQNRQRIRSEVLENPLFFNKTRSSVSCKVADI